jgi:formate-dependent nitrite reductase membrane component NrfD
VSGGFLALTGILLIWDLEHPGRFYMIFTRPQWRSWLVKGAFIIAGYTVVLVLHFFGTIFDLFPGAGAFHRWLMFAGIPLAVLTAIYTAYLFAQAKARDLWQNPLLPPHLLVQALLLGSVVLLPVFMCYQDTLENNVWSANAIVVHSRLDHLLWILALSSLLHILMIMGEVSVTHVTSHARLAVWEMVHGRYRNEFWIGVSLSVLSAIFVSLCLFGVMDTSLSIGAAPLALIGMALYEHAYVQAGQSVPLA